MSRLYVIAVPLLASCGALKPQFVSRSVPTVNQYMPELPDDAEVTLIAHEFYADAQALNVKTERDVKSITFVDFYGKCSTTIGQCTWFKYEDGTVAYKTITMLKSAWERGSPQMKRTLLYHELGHCALNLDHAPNGSNAIMNPIILNDSVAVPEWFKLVKELFGTQQEQSLLTDEQEDEC